MGVIAEERVKDFNNHRIREFAVKLCLLEMSEATPMTEILPTWLPKHDLNKDNTKRHDKLEGEAHEIPTRDN